MMSWWEDESSWDHFLMIGSEVSTYNVTYEIGPFSNSKWVYWSQTRQAGEPKSEDWRGPLKIPSIPGWERFGGLLVRHRFLGKPWNCSWNWHLGTSLKYNGGFGCGWFTLGSGFWSSNMLMGFLLHWGFKNTISTSAISSGESVDS